MAKKILSPLEKIKRARNILIGTTSVLGVGTITSTSLAIYYATRPRGGDIIIHDAVVKGGSALIQTNDETTTTDTSSWKLYSQDKEVTGATWTISVSPTTNTITLNKENKIVCDKVPVGDYTVTIKATSDELKAEAKMSVLSRSAGEEEVVITDVPSQMVATESYECKAKYYPTTSVPTLTWSVEGWTGTDETKPTVDEKTGKLVTKDGAGEFTIKVTEPISGKSDSRVVKVVLPYTNSDKVWSKINGEWNWFDMTDLRTSGNSIKQYNAKGEQVKEITRTDFKDYSLMMGDDLVVIPDDFLIDATEFVGSINFTKDSKCSIIGSCFMQGCTKYNSTLTLPASLRVIDDGFLDGCVAFNNGAAADFVLPESLTTIGTDFLNNCQAFNQTLTIGEKITHIGESFMVNCYAMVSTITLNIDPTGIFSAHGSTPDTLSTDNEEAACYTTGLTIASEKPEYVARFKTLFPQREKSSSITETFRKYKA